LLDRPRAGGARRDGRGKSNRGIAESLYITEAAVEKHVRSIFQKLGLGPTTHENRRVRAVLTFVHASRRR
jgi:DNA-binding NarL/FixJ family response regulator